MAKSRTSRTRSSRNKASSKRLSFKSGFLTGVVVVGAIWITTSWIRQHGFVLPSQKNHSLTFDFKKIQKNTLALVNKDSNPIKLYTSSQPTSQSQQSVNTAPLPRITNNRPFFLVFLASFKNFHQADDQRAYLILNGFDAKVSKSPQLNSYVLWIGPYQSLEDAYHAQLQLKNQYNQSRISTNTQT